MPIRAPYRALAAALLLGAALPAAALAQTGGGFERASLADSLTRSLAQARAVLAAGDAEGAVSEYRRAQGFLGLDILYGDVRDPDPASAEIARGLAEAYLELGDPYAAAVEAERGTAVEPADARLWTLLCLARHRLADMSGARAAIGHAINLDEREADAHWCLGLIAIAQNRPREATERAERALALRPDPRYALSLARWSAAAGDYGRAAAALSRWLELRRRDPAAEGYANLQRFYEILARGPVAVTSTRVTRVQLGFDLKEGDEIPYVPVRFNGGAPVYVLFDTGAEINVIDQAFAREMAIGSLLPGGRLHGAYRQSPGGYTIVDSVTLGSINVSRVPFAVGDFGALSLRSQGSYYIAAVINPALLFRDFLVILDYRDRRIELIRYDAGADAYLARFSPRRRTTVPLLFDVNGAWPIVRARLDGGRELPFLIDTGASDLLIGRPAAAALRVNPRSFGVALGPDYRRERLRGLLLDGVPSEPWGIEIEGILGYPFFRGARLAFDYRSMRVIVEN